MAHPEVIRSIQENIDQAMALSAADVRLAVTLGLVSADAARVTGLNDGVFYDPTDLGPQLMGATAEAPPSVIVRKESTTGSLHALCLLVDFDDNVGTRPAADFEHLLFDAGNPGSMTSFYKDLSYGALSITGEVVGYVRVPNPYSFYTDGHSGMGEGFPRNTPGLLQDALTEFCKTDSLARFDVDGDGYVDGVFLVHAGTGAETESDPALRKNMIWSTSGRCPPPSTTTASRSTPTRPSPEDGKNANAGDDGDLFPGSAGVTSIDDNTNPSTRSTAGAATGVAFRSISVAGGTASLDVEL
jgi:immune inhibitor A